MKIERGTVIEAPRNPSFRWFRFLVVPMLINVSSLVLFPMFLRDALDLPLLAICGVPILWSGYMLFDFRSLPERVIAYLATLMAVVWAAAILHLLTSYGWHSYQRTAREAAEKNIRAMENFERTNDFKK